MKILLNGEDQTRPEGETVAQLLVDLGLGGSPCAVEVNRHLVPKGEHPSHTLGDGDEVEIVTLVGGG